MNGDRVIGGYVLRRLLGRGGMGELLSPLRPRVIDFGIARLVGHDGLTSQAILGTPAFMATEQVRGEPLTPAADVFAWGGMIAFAATGRLPFGSGVPAEVLSRITQEGPVLDGLDDGIRAVVERAPAKDARLRPTAQQLLAELVGGTRLATATEVVERTLTGSPVQAGTSGVAGGVKRRWWPWVAGGVAVVAAAVSVPGLVGERWPYEAVLDDGWEVGASEGGDARISGAGYELTVNRGRRLWNDPHRAGEVGVFAAAEADRSVRVRFDSFTVRPVDGT
ncbi:protein kinase domain-containing protein [Nonomuraea terrae]|nr:hypothetical protein [Nonomuraea terrae]